MKIRLGISEAISHWAKYNPQKKCIVNESYSLSFCEFNSIVNYISDTFFYNKVPNQCIPIMIENKLLLLATIIAAVRCGKYPAILNANLELKEIDFTLNDLQSDILFTEQKFQDKTPNGITLFKIDNSIVENNRNFSSETKWESPVLNNTWGILYSSGTTGNPKGIVRSHFSIISELLGWCFELETRITSHYYIARPVYYTGGLVLSLTTLLVGGKVSVYDTFSPQLYFKQIEQEKIDLSFLVPSQINMLIEYINNNNIANPPFSKTILSMGAVFPVDIKIKANRHLKSNIIESWGNTEGLGTITSPGDLKNRPSSIGKPFLTDELFIVDDNFERVKPNTIGRLAGRVDSKFSEYNNRKELSEQLIKEDLIISEDLGMEDENGYFFLYGRVSDVINTSSGKIYPIIIEKVISSFDEVEEVAVIGISENNIGVPACVIKAKSTISDLEDLRCRINAKLNDNENMKHIKVISEFPKTASGKIIKSDLKHLFS